MSDPVVGIDLGTSNTVVAHTGATGAAQVLADGQGFKIHPSVVSFHPTGGVVVGAAAKQRKVIDPKNTIYSVKRLIGRSFSSPEVQTARQRMPYQIKQGANQLPLIVTRAGEFAVPEISAIVLDHAKNIATTALGTPITRAVVSVPASFNDAQRSATATAGSIAGLDVLRVINEPTAAALAYGATRNLREIIAVYDFGGGTFDITILKLADQVYEVLGTAGDTFLGGDDLDERLVDRMVEKFLMENRVDLRQNEVSMMRLRAVAEQVKIELSRRSRAMVRVDEIAYGPKGKPLDLQIEIKRDELVRQCADLIDRTFPVCEEALKYANLTIDHIDDVVLVGGTTKIPYVRDQVAKFFAKAPRTDVNPEEAVALGAGLQAAALERATAAPARSTARGVAPAFDEHESTFGGDSTGGTETFSRNPPEPTNPEPTIPAERGGRRAATRGDHHDVFEDRTPPPIPPGAPVIGRLTKEIKPTAAKPAITKTQALPVVRPPAPPRPAAPRPGASVQIPPAASPASTLRGVAPIHEDEDDFPDPKTKRDDHSFQHIGTETGIADLDPLGFPNLATEKDMNPASTAKGFTPPATTSPPTRPAAPPPVRPAAPPPSPPAATRGPTSQLPLQPPTPPRAQASSPTVIVEPQPVPATAPDARTLIGAQSATLLASAGAAPASRDSQMPTFVADPPASAYVPASYAAPAPPSPVVVDVTPRGLGIGTVAGYCEELIRRNSRVPTEMRKLFTTSRDGQDSVRIIVCQGESRKLANNTVIADLLLEGLTPRPRGETSIEVTFALDANGILQVRARDAQTGREQRASLDIVGTIQEQDVDAAREKLQALRR